MTEPLGSFPSAIGTAPAISTSEDTAGTSQVASAVDDPWDFWAFRVGGNLFMTENSDIEGTGSDITIPDFYNISNFTTQEVDASLPRELIVISFPRG